jgi:hypothetical protein
LRELALHLLDIAENSVAAGAKTVQLAVEESAADDRLRLMVQDDGRGMSAEMVAKVTDPFVTSRTTRKVGLGIPFLRAAAEACNGWLKLESQPGHGTRLEAEFQRSHIDRMPLGDLAGTVLSLVIAFPNIHWVFNYRVNSAEFTFDDQPVKQELGDVSLTEPSILAYLRRTLETGVAETQKAI